MRTVVNVKSYRSPKHKLLAFFKSSRDQWRTRAKEYHQEKRFLQTRIRDLEASRDHWRERYFEERPALAANSTHRGHEPPPAGAIARRSSTRTLNA
jgi:hypothetical protein